MHLLVRKGVMILGWCDAFCFFEHLCEYAIVTVARFHGDIRDGKICGNQQFSCMFHAYISQICQKVDTNFTAEQLGDILWVEMELLG